MGGGSSGRPSTLSDPQGPSRSWVPTPGIRYETRRDPGRRRARYRPASFHRNRQDAIEVPSGLVVVYPVLFPRPVVAVSKSHYRIADRDKVEIGAIFMASQNGLPFCGNSPCPAVDVMNTMFSSVGRSSMGYSSIAMTVVLSPLALPLVPSLVASDWALPLSDANKMVRGAPNSPSKSRL